MEHYNYIISYRYSPEDWSPYYITTGCETWKEVEEIIKQLKESDYYSDIRVEESYF